MKEANHWCDLPLFTYDPPDTRITTLIPAALAKKPKMLSPPIRWVPFFPLQMTDEGSGGCQTALRVSPRAHRGMKQEDLPASGSGKGKGFEIASRRDIDK